jgi:hypothetical protein
MGHLRLVNADYFRHKITQFWNSAKEILPLRSQISYRAKRTYHTFSGSITSDDCGRARRFSGPEDRLRLRNAIYLSNTLISWAPRVFAGRRHLSFDESSSRDDASFPAVTGRRYRCAVLRCPSIPRFPRETTMPLVASVDGLDEANALPNVLTAFWATTNTNSALNGGIRTRF